MATKNQSPAASPEGLQPEEKAPELINVAVLREQHKISRAVFAGVCAANGWIPGKAVSEDVFLRAVQQFQAAPMGGAGEGVNSRA